MYCHEVKNTFMEKGTIFSILSLLHFYKFSWRKNHAYFYDEKCFLCDSGNKSPNSNIPQQRLAPCWPMRKAGQQGSSPDWGYKPGLQVKAIIDRITQQPWCLWSSFCSSELPVSVKLLSSRLPSSLLTVCRPLSQNLVQNNQSMCLKPRIFFN